MLLKNLKIKNFARFTDAEINLQDYKKALIVGIINNDAGDSNGSGKTSLIDSIGWCVWGESKAKTVDENVKFGTRLCFVSLEFEHDGKECSIIRTRDKERGLSTVNFYINGELSNGKTVTDTNKKIVSFLRLDYSTYVNSVYLRQDDIFSFADNGTNKEGRDILEKVLSLEEYDLYQDEARAEIKRISREVEVIELSMAANVGIDEKIESAKTAIDEKLNKLTSAKIEIGSMSVILETLINKRSTMTEKMESFINAKSKIRELTAVVDALKNEVNGLIRRFNSDSDEKKCSIERLQKNIDELTVINTRMKEHEEHVVENSNNKKRVAEIGPKLIDLKKNLTEKSSVLMIENSKFLVLKSKAQDVVSQIQSKKTRIDSGPEEAEYCSECLTEITESTVEHFKNHLKEEIIKLETQLEEMKNILVSKKTLNERSQKEIDKINLEISSLDAERNELNKKCYTDGQMESFKSVVQRELNAVGESQKELELINKSNKIEEIKKEIESKKTIYLAKKAELEKEQLNQPKEELVDFASMDKQIGNTTSELDKLKENSHILSAAIKNYESSLESFDIIKKEIDKHKLSLGEKKRDLSILNRLQEAFSSKGIRADIIENAIAELEKHSNELLGRLTSGRLSVEFKTKKEIKASKGEQIEKVVFEVIVNDDGTSLPFHLYSGGEKFRVAFVLRLALAKLLQHRASSKLEFLIIDEAFASMDQNGVVRVIEVINQLMTEFKTILVVSHRNDVKEQFDQIITVLRDEDGSRILL